jgi:hypothetical protein
MWTPEEPAVDEPVDESVDNGGQPGEKSRDSVDILGTRKCTQNHFRKGLVRPLGRH